MGPSDHRFSATIDRNDCGDNPSRRILSTFHASVCANARWFSPGTGLRCGGLPRPGIRHDAAQQHANVCEGLSEARVSDTGIGGGYEFSDPFSNGPPGSASWAPGSQRHSGLSGMVPVILTVMIAIPSFLLGTALGISEGMAAIVILLAILAHKGSAAFALALAMVRSTLTRFTTSVLFAAFACATPLGVIIGADIHEHLSGRTMLVVKGTILSLAGGVFVFMATLHEMEYSPLIVQCRKVKGFAAMLFGLGITALVVLLMGLARS